MKVFPLVALLFLFTLTTPIAGQEGPLYLDPSQPPGETVLELRGAWEFHQGVFLDPREPPGTHEKFQDPPSFSGPGFGTYRYLAELPAPWVGRELGLLIPTVNSAATIFLDGKPVAHLGRPSPVKEFDVPSQMSRMISLRPSSSTLNLVIHVSCHDFVSGGFFQLPKIGPLEAVRNLKARQDFITALLIGALGIMLVYHLLLLTIRRKDRTLFHFSTLIFLILLRIILIDLTALDWGAFYLTKVRVEYASYFLLVASFLTYLRRLYPKEFPRLFIRINLGITLLLTLSALLLPVLFTSRYLVSSFRFYTLGVIAVSFYSLIRAMMAGRENIVIFFAGAGLLLLGAVNDSLYYAKILRTQPLAQFSLLAFIFSQAGIMALRYNRLFSENLRLTRSLEAQVDERTRDLKNAMEALEEASLTDPLTGLRNRRFVYETIFREASALMSRESYHLLNPEKRSPNTSAGMGFLLLDVDHFKITNDTYGHDAGDEVLRQLSQVIRSTLRAEDLVVRWGGEEFLVVLKDLSPEDLAPVAEKIRSAVESWPFHLQGGQNICIQKTVSLGAVGLPFHRDYPGALDAQDALTLADMALYQGKKAGRNRSVIAVPGPGFSGFREESLPGMQADEVLTQGYVVFATAGIKAP